MPYRYRSIARQLAGAVLAVGGTLVLSAGPSKAALSVTASTDAAAMAAALIGPGVNIVPGSATYTGTITPPYQYDDASGFFSGDTSIFGNPAGASGVLLTTGSVTNALPPNNKPADPMEDGATQVNEFPGSAYLNTLVSGIETFDASTLTFKITLDPGMDGLQWTYVFGSEEYPDFVGFQFNDIFALSLDGANLALIPSTSVPVAINNVNSLINSQYYRDNPVFSNNYATQYNGLTTVLTSTAAGLTPGVEYTLSFAIADAEDYSYDSGVFLLADSIRGMGPVDPVSEVPGPLPLLGAGAALAWSRRLRSRINDGVRSR